MRVRALLLGMALSVALPSAAHAISDSVYTELPPSSVYKFYETGRAKGSLTVHGKAVSKITFTLPTGQLYHQAGCLAPVGRTEQSTIPVTVSGSFKLVRQKPVAHGYRFWVVGGVDRPHPANEVGVSPIPAKFTIRGLTPVSGKLGIFFSNNGAGVETGGLYASFGGCLSEDGDFDHGYHG